MLGVLRERLRKWFSYGCRQSFPFRRRPPRWAGRGPAHDVGLSHDVVSTTNHPPFTPRPQQSGSDQLHVDVVASLDEIVAGPPLGWRQVDHPLDREPRALDDRRLDYDLETLADERLADVLEGDPLHVRA